MPSHRGEVIVAAASHGREEVCDEACSNRVKHCWHRYEGVDERQNMEFGEPDGNDFGCWCGLSCATTNGEITVTSILDRGKNQAGDCQRGDEHLGTCDGSGHDGSRSSTVDGVACQWLAKIDPMNWVGPGPSRQCKVTTVNVSTNRVDGRTLLGVIRRVINCDCEK